MGFFRQEYWSGLLCPSPRALPHPGSNSDLPHCRQILWLSEPAGKLQYHFIFPITIWKRCDYWPHFTGSESWNLSIIRVSGEKIIWSQTKGSLQVQNFLLFNVKTHPLKCKFSTKETTFFLFHNILSRIILFSILATIYLKIHLQ